MATATQPNSLLLERYATAAKAAGCPRDQVENFLRAGVVLQPMQLRASAAARLCDFPNGPTEIGVGGSRGPGKSHWALAQVAADDCQRFPSLKALLLRKVGKAAKESFEDLRQRVLMNLGHNYRRQEGVVTFSNGSRIVIGHFQKENDIDAYLGIEYDVILTEEATTLSSSKAKAISTCCRTSKTGWRPRQYKTTNPGGIGHASFKERFVTPWRQDRQTETRFIPGTVYDNRFINPEYRRNLEALTGWQRQAWLDGNWDIAAGQFFTTWRNEVHVVKPFPIPQGWRKWASLDYGFTHYTSVHLLAQSGDGDIYCFDEHGERGWLPQRHGPAIHAMLARHNLKVHNLWQFVAGADVFARKPDGGTIADAYQSEGFTLTPANDDRINGAGEILKRLGDVSAGIRPSLYIFDRCARLIECIPALQHDPHRPEDVLKWDTDEDGQGGDDFYDSARYAVMAAARQDVPRSYGVSMPAAQPGVRS